MTLREKMLADLEQKTLFEMARKFAYEYIDQTEETDVFPSAEALEKLAHFNHPLQSETLSANEIMQQFYEFGTPGAVRQTGGRYFGFVNGGAVPASLGVKWLSDVWDQNGGLFYTSPINAKLETVCENWLKDIFSLPEESTAVFVSGTSMANLCCVAAARFHLLNKLGWDIHNKGLHGAPLIRIIAHKQVHASIHKTFGILGYGKDNIEWIPSDDQGRIIVDKLPKLDSNCLVILQAGNANTGAFDDFDAVCDIANEADAWVHIDGAFGLWAGATEKLSYLTKGMEKADSWAVDGHKTLNTPYDSGIALCKHQDSLIQSMQATGEYIMYSDQRDPILFGPEMSKRTRALEFWATMKYLGKQGIDEMVYAFHERSKQLESGLRKHGFQILNNVVFNQVLIAGQSEEQTKQVLVSLQQSGRMWCGGTTWLGKAAIRMSICSWRTSEADIEEVISLFAKGKANC